MKRASFVIMQIQLQKSGLWFPMMKRKKSDIMLLNEMGIDVEDYRFDSDEEQLYMIRTIEGKKYELPFDHESDGARKLIAALPVILVALREGRLVIIDELDAKLHPKLLRYVISIFKNRKINKYGGSFYSHHMILPQ